MLILQNDVLTFQIDVYTALTLMIVAIVVTCLYIGYIAGFHAGSKRP